MDSSWFSGMFGNGGGSAATGGSGFFDSTSNYLKENPWQVSAALGQMASAIDPKGETLGGAVGAGMAGLAQSKVMSDKAALDDQNRKALMSKYLGVEFDPSGKIITTPPGTPGATSESKKMLPNGDVEHKFVVTPGEAAQTQAAGTTPQAPATPKYGPLRDVTGQSNPSGLNALTSNFGWEKPVNFQ